MADGLMRLHIGGKERREGWTNLNIAPGPTVDIVGSCEDLGMIADESCEVVYASHVIEHLTLRDALRCLTDVRRILHPDGSFYISVPNAPLIFDVFRRVGGDPLNKFLLMKILFGGQADEHDVHKFAYDEEMLQHVLASAGFAAVRRVDEFGIFNDTSSSRLNDLLLSINLIATR